MKRVKSLWRLLRVWNKQLWCVHDWTPNFFSTKGIEKGKVRHFYVCKKCYKRDYV